MAANFYRDGSPNYDVDLASEETSLGFEDSPSRTVQCSAEETDINAIVKRFGVTGHLPQGFAMPAYQDFDEVFDFQSAQNVIIQANQEFMKLSGEVRARFENDPQQLLEFMADDNNRDEAVKLGLVPAPPVLDPPTPKA